MSRSSSGHRALPAGGEFPTVRDEVDPHTRVVEQEGGVDVGTLLDGAPDGLLVIDDAGTVVMVNRQAETMFGYPRTRLVGQPIEVLVPDRLRQGHRAHRLRYRAEPRVRPMGAGVQLWARNAEGREFPVEISLSPVRSGSSTFVMAAVRDVTLRRQSEAEHRRVLASLDATHDGVFIFDCESWRFSYVNEGAVDLTGYGRDKLLEMTPLHVFPAGEDELRRRLAPLGEGQRSVTFETDLRSRTGEDVPVELLVQLPATADTVRPEDAAPSYVAIVRDVTERHIAEAQEKESLELLTTYNERERIARDLHDVVIQRLFGAGMSLQAAVPSAGSPQLAERLLRIVDDLDDTIRQIRSVIFRLQGPSGPSGGLRTKILQVVDESSRMLGFEPRLRMDGPIDAAIPDDTAEHLLAVLREALSNAARHAHASRVSVTVHASDAVMLRVEDDGVGLPAGGLSEVATGHGLENLTSRAAALRGSAHVGPGPQGGTIVEWRVPLS